MPFLFWLLKCTLISESFIWAFFFCLFSMPLSASFSLLIFASFYLHLFFCIFFSSSFFLRIFFCIFFPHFSTFATFRTFCTLTQGRVRGSRGEDPGRLKRMISLNDQGLSKIWYQTFWHTFCACLICSTRNRIWHIIQSLENSKKILINVTESLNYLQILSSIYLPFG